MTPEDDWNAIRGEREPLFSAAGLGMLRVALLFGTAAVALALILAPVADRYARSGPERFDYNATGSIGQRNSYTIRRSVLQYPGVVCIIRATGERSNGCSDAP
jgi:hypothetical protein